MVSVTIEEQLRILSHGCECIEPLSALRGKLDQSDRTGEPLRVKLGLDPTAPDIHLGHAVVLRKLRQFQDFGHKAVLLVGDFTARIGDPAGRSKTRPVLTSAEIEANAMTYLDQIGRLLDRSPEKLEIVRNSSWLEPMSAADLLRLAGTSTVAQMLDRDDFQKRYQAYIPIGVHEFLYPLLQGHDSVVTKADVELGGTDQIFNLLVGRDLQRQASQEPQVAITMPLLVGLDGIEKMSKSIGNQVGVADQPHDMFGKLMSLPDECMVSYFTLLTSLTSDQVKILCDVQETPPMTAKKTLAAEVASVFHDRVEVEQAQIEWEQIHQKSMASGGSVAPATTPIFKVPDELLRERKTSLPGLLTACGLAASKSEARRLVQQRGVRLNGAVVTDSHGMIGIKTGDILQRGKRVFLRLQIGPGNGEQA